MIQFPLCFPSLRVDHPYLTRLIGVGFLTAFGRIPQTVDVNYEETSADLVYLLFSRDSLIFVGLNGLKIRSNPKLI
jgi:hypothetical protein